MTYHSDPPRWTDTPGHAPELLREGLEAASREGPSELQMRSLALKLAAVGAGAALTVASAKATSTAAASLTTTSSSALSKIAVSMALVGAAATGGSWLLHRRAEPPLTARDPAPVVVPMQPAREPARAVAQPQPLQPVTTPLVPREPSVAPAVEVAPVEVEQVADARDPIDSIASIEDTRAELNHAEHRRRRHERAEAAERAALESAAPPVPVRAPSLEIVNVKGQPRQLSEIDLLTKARAALAGRPRDAYRLTEQHKSLYPQGMFAQERDALAVEALQRAGDLRGARELAQSFLTRYPDSPAAHRFRETMNLP